VTDREYPSRPIVGVGAVVMVGREVAPQIGWSEPCERAGIVVVKRRFEPLAGQWSIPGGTLEVGETLEAGVAREIVEETGLIVTVGPIVDVFDRIFRDEDGRVRYHYVLVDYVCEARAGRLAAGSDVSDVAVADPVALTRFALLPKTLEVIRKVMALDRGRFDGTVS
jgi:ADP-ribose pyrophosphatase YjhB (NUDIX family)